MDDANKSNYIDVPKSISWDEYFMLLALMSSYKSKDPATKVGCVFVDQNNHQLSMGYNGFVAGVDESQVPWGDSEEADHLHRKHGYVVHAEANAILHSQANLAGSKLYVTLFPCPECAKMVATKKVKEVIYLSDKFSHKESTQISKRVFELAGIHTRQFVLPDEIIRKFSHYCKDFL